MAKRTKALRVGIVGDLDSSVVEGLDKLPGRTKLRTFGDLYEDFDDVVSHRPRLLLIAAERLREADLGALRLLRDRLDDHTRTLLVAPAASTTDVESLARRINARVLRSPFTEADLARALDRADGSPPVATYLDITRGLADEIANPLMFALGHTQLIEATLAPDHEAIREQLVAVRSGLERITRSVEKVRLIAEIHDQAPPLEAATVRELLEHAVDRVNRFDRGDLVVEDGAERIAVRGDPELLQLAFENLFGVCSELRAAGAAVRATVDSPDDGLRVRVHVDGERIQDWASARAFEPYQLSRALRGTNHGLSLFLVQAIVHAHGGRAFARRRKQGGVRLEIRLVGA